MFTQPIKFSLFILGLVCAFISLLCSALLWVSFANSLLDSILMGIASSAFVAASYLFVPVILRLLQFKKWAMLIAVLSLEVILAISSLMATIGFLESRYQNQFDTELTNSQGYKHQQASIDTLTIQINELIALAKTDRETDYRQRAERLLNKATRLTHERDRLISKTISHTSTNAGNTLANDLGENRYVLWSVLAILVDGCPMACFALVSLKTTTPGKTLAPIKAALPPTNAARADNLDELYEELASEISAGKYGDKPAIRNIITDKRIRHATAKKLFDRLVTNNILEVAGNRFVRVA